MQSAVAPFLDHDAMALREEIASLKAARAADAAEIAQLQATMARHETAYQVVKGTADDLQRALDLEKKLHEVTRQEVNLAYALLSEAYEMHRSSGGSIIVLRHRGEKAALTQETNAL